MKEYKGEQIRNIVVAAHGGAGKTSLCDAFLFNSGAVNRQGRVDDGSSVLDFEPEEQKRRVTISAALAPCEWKDCKINFIDTPGTSDFYAEVIGGMRAADSALVVICANAGVEVLTEKIWLEAGDRSVPRLAFINKMDREHADFDRVLAAMKDRLDGVIVPVQLPIGAESSFRGIVDLLENKAYMPEEAPIPAEMAEAVELARMQLVEAAAEGDDELLEKYLDGGELSEEEVRIGLLKAVSAGRVTPVLCGSATKNVGVKQLMNAVVRFMPSPAAVVARGVRPGSDEPVERKAADPFSALVFKTTADPFVGRLSFARLFSGQLKADMPVYNANKGKTEKIGGLFTLRGKQQEPMTVAHAGDIVVLAKLQDTGTGDTLCSKESPVEYPGIIFPSPNYIMAVEAKKKGDEDKISGTLQRIADEDPTFKFERNTETGQLLIRGMGDQHINIILERMKRKFGVEVNLTPPKVAYRETIRCKAKAEGKHKKQSGGRGQYGHVWLEIEPLPSGGGFEFVDKIFGGAVPNNYIPAVEKGARESFAKGLVAGYPMVDVRVTLFDGSYHDVDSSELAFKLATSIALKKAVPLAKGILLEPIYNVEITVPEANMGDVMGDLNTRRGRPQGMENIGRGLGVVKAQVPLAEMFSYAIDLRSMTQGRGSFVMSFSHYEEVPHNIAEGIIAEALKNRQEDDE
ncbi:MAG: elongation factor G [Negativicutes bacterium]|nr:elongation factor G [Negativicutes bacterium]